MKYLFVAGALCLSAVATTASEQSDAAAVFAQSQDAAWISHHAIVNEITAKDQSTNLLSQADINTLDQTWRTEVGTADAPLIASVMNNAASEHLRTHVAEAGGRITEVFVMDARGLNVASSAITSDYWQGDEAKWIDTYMKGADAIHVSEVEFDESAQTYQMQVSMSVTDPASGAVIGAVTFGLDAQAFF